MFIFVVLNTRALAPFVPMLRAPKKLYRASLKDHVEIGHLTKYDAFRVNRDQNTVQNPYKRF